MSDDHRLPSTPPDAPRSSPAFRIVLALTGALAGYALAGLLVPGDGAARVLAGLALAAAAAGALYRYTMPVMAVVVTAMPVALFVAGAIALLVR